MPEDSLAPLSRARFRGCLFGLAVGDALGTSVEFMPPGSFPRLTDITGGGPFDLAPGEWTDDTSMALCLAESLVERADFNPTDQLEIDGQGEIVFLTTAFLIIKPTLRAWIP